MRIIRFQEELPKRVTVSGCEKNVGEFTSCFSGLWIDGTGPHERVNALTYPFIKFNCVQYRFDPSLDDGTVGSHEKMDPFFYEEHEVVVATHNGASIGGCEDCRWRPKETK